MMGLSAELVAYGARQQTEMALAGEIMTGCTSRMLVSIRVIGKIVVDVTRARVSMMRVTKTSRLGLNEVSAALGRPNHHVS
jgi:hypothetical protein